MQDIEIAIVDGKYDLRQYQCPMNLVIAKHIIYAKKPQSLVFLLSSEQAATNITNFLEFKGYCIIKSTYLEWGIKYYSIEASCGNL